MWKSTLTSANRYRRSGKTGTRIFLLVTVPSPYRSIVAPLLEYLDRTDMEINDGQQAVLILPEFVPAHWWQGFLHNQTAWLIKMALLYGKRHFGYQRVIIDVPYYLKD